MANEDLLWALARRLVQEDAVSQEEFHFMLYEYKAQMYPYKLFGDTKVDEMPYQNTEDSIAEDLFENIPKFSELMPTANELTDPEAIAKLPALKAQYEADEATQLEKMRRPNPLMNEDWGKSKMEIVAEAKAAAANEARKSQCVEGYGGTELPGRTIHRTSLEACKTMMVGKMFRYYAGSSHCEEVDDYAALQFEGGGWLTCECEAEPTPEPTPVPTPVPEPEPADPCQCVEGY